MLFEKIKNKIIGVAVVVVHQAVLSCSAMEPMPLNIKPIEIHKGNKHAVPAKRKIIKVGELSEENGKLVLKALKNSDKVKRGFVTSSFYLKIDARVIGLVFDEENKFLGFNVTGNDARNIPAARTHTVLIPKDKNKLQGLLREWMK